MPPWRRWRACSRGWRRSRRRCAFRLRLCGWCDTGRRRRFRLDRRSGRRNWRLRLDRRSSRRNWRFRLHGCRRWGDRGLRRNRRRRGRRSGGPLRRCGYRRLMSWGRRLVRRRRRRRRCGRLWRCGVRRWRNSMWRWWRGTRVVAAAARDVVPAEQLWGAPGAQRAAGPSAAAWVCHHPACATTSDPVCACKGGLANCIAERAVVASSTRRSLVMMIWIPGKLLTTRFDDQRISIRPDCGGLPRRPDLYF